MGGLGGLFGMGGGSGGGMGMGGIIPMLMQGKGMGLLQMLQGAGGNDQQQAAAGSQQPQSQFLQPLQRQPTMANFLQGRGMVG